MKTVVVGTQTGKKDEYEIIRSLANDDAIILDDANPAELERFMLEKQADILVGGVKERPLAYKLGVAFCDHNHERKHPLAGFIGIENFIKEIHESINSPVWRYVKEGRSERKSDKSKCESLKDVYAYGRGERALRHQRGYVNSARVAGLCNLYPPAHGDALQRTD